MGVKNITQKQNNKNKITTDIINAAKSYKRNLVGKTFLYVFDNQYIEVMFKAKDFRHLTGVDTNLTAQDFYKKAHSGILRPNQIYFSARHPYPLAVKKLKHLQNISSLTINECFMLKDITTQSEVYKFGTTDLHFSICFNQETDDKGIKKGNCYIAKSLRDEDCFTKSDKVFIITHIFSKPNDQKLYENEIYRENGYAISDLPSNIISMLSKDLLNKV